MYEQCGLLRCQLTRKGDGGERVAGWERLGVTSAQLVEKPAAIGVVDFESNIRNMLAQGKSTAVF